MEIYKKGDAKLTRRVAYFGILVLVVWGFREFAKQLMAWEWTKSTRKVLWNFELPFYQQPLSIAVGICILLTIVVGFYLFKLLNGNRVGPLLVDTESELKKVAWPSWDDAKQSTVIVLVFVAATAMFLTAVEFGLKHIFDFILI